MIRTGIVAVFALLLLGAATAPVAPAASETEVERLSSFALLLGRGIGCNLDTKRAARAISSWFERTFPADSGEQERYLPVFAGEVERHARQQRGGGSPDSCADVAHAFYTMRW
jgi:hypothetical protein